MSGRFVRASKYRHVFGRSTKKEQCYDNLRISKNAWDTNLIKANPEYLSVNWESGGGGAFAVIPINERGRLPELIPLFRGHTAAVLDTDWNPFNDSILASGSDDGKVGIWRVPDNFTLYSDAEEPVDVAPQAKLTGHSRKVGHVLFNPAAENVLASSSGDYTVKMWDVEAGAPKLTLKHSDIVQSMSWSANGSLLVTTARDKKLRIWDVRQEKPVHEGQGHHGAKNSRAVWMGEHDRIATTGFSKMSDRQLGLWDVRAPREPINGFDILDSISGVCMPFWDEGTQCLYLAGKGDGNIRYYEYENDKFEYLSEYKSGDPQRGVAFMPKRGVNVHENEVVRCFKTVNDQYIEPISFIVPRRAEVFQDDIYPPTVGIKPAMSAPEWFSGKEAIPPKISLEQVYEGTEPVEVVGTEDKRSAVPGESQASKPSEPEAPKSTPAPKAAPAPVAVEPTPTSFTKGPTGSIKDNKDSMSAMASKFADRDEDAKDEDSGSSAFDEVSKPVERPSASLTARMEEKTKGPEISKAPDSSAVNASAAKAAEPASKPSTASTSTPSSTQPNRPASGSVSGTTPSGAAEGIKGYLSDIKAMLENQNVTMTSQMEQIAHLTAEVNLLKGKLAENDEGHGRNEGGSDEKDERIRELELELEKVRS